MLLCVCVRVMLTCLFALQWNLSQQECDQTDTSGPKANRGDHTGLTAVSGERKREGNNSIKAMMIKDKDSY